METTYKLCNKCHAKNLQIAKYCLNCEHPFGQPVKTTNASKKALEVDFNPTITVVDDESSFEEGLDGDSRESKQALRGLFRVEGDGKQTGIKFEDAIGTAQGGRNTLGKRKNKDKRSGKTILREDGGNSARFANKRGEK